MDWSRFFSPVAVSLGCVLLALSQGACTDLGGKRYAERARSDLPRLQTFLASLPSCSADEQEGALSPGSLSPDGGHALRVRGFLKPGGEGTCTVAYCGPGTGTPGVCCNDCWGRWVVTAPGLAPDEAVVLEDQPSLPLGWSVKDCTLRELERAVVPVEVVVQGSLRRGAPPPAFTRRAAPWLLRPTRICTLEAKGEWGSLRPANRG